MNINRILSGILILFLCVSLAGCHVNKEPQCAVVDENTLSLCLDDPETGENSFGHRIYRLSNMEEGTKSHFNVFVYSNGSGETIFSSEPMTAEGDTLFFCISVNDGRLSVSTINDEGTLQFLFERNIESAFPDSVAHAFNWLEHETDFLNEIILFQYDGTMDDTLATVGGSVFDADLLTRNTMRSGFVITIKGVE